MFCGLKVLDDGGTERGVEVYASEREGVPLVPNFKVACASAQILPWLALINATCRVCFTAIKERFWIYTSFGLKMTPQTL